MSGFLPEMNQTLRGFFGLGTLTPGAVKFPATPCACWASRGRQLQGEGGKMPRVVAQLAVVAISAYNPPGWVGWPEVWHPELADVFNVQTGGGATLSLSPVSCGFMWQGTPEAHVRFALAPWSGSFPTFSQQHPTGRQDGIVTSFDCYRPFGAAGAVFVNQPGVFYADNPQGRGSYSGGNYYSWTHYLDFSLSLDVRDGQSRASGLNTLSYADGDEVRVPTGGAVSKYVVVWVTKLTDLEGNGFKRAYLMRDLARWPGP